MNMKALEVMTMKKSTLLNRLEQIRLQAEDEEIKAMRPLEILDLVLEYVNDKDIRDAIEAVPM